MRIGIREDWCRERILGTAGFAKPLPDGRGSDIPSFNVWYGQAKRRNAYQDASIVVLDQKGKEDTLFLDFIGIRGTLLTVQTFWMAMDVSVRDGGLIIDVIIVPILSMSANRIHSSL